MAVYIAFLRGINVGGKNMIKMADLREMFTHMEYDRVQTYIQSGNVLFETEQTEDVLGTQIHEQIKKNFGLAVDVILRRADELQKMMTDCPFSQVEIAEAESTAVGEHLYVALLPCAPAKNKIDQINSVNYEGEKAQAVGRNIYLLFSHSIRNSKLGNSLQKLGVTSTIRNWKSISKLNALAKEMIQDIGAPDDKG